MAIREFITSYLKDRDITLVELTAKLGYRSKTSIVRILNGDISTRSLEGFADRLRRVGGLTETECVHLDEAMELLKWQDDYYSSKEMLGFLQGYVPETGDVMLKYVNPECIEQTDRDIPLIFDDAFSGGTDIEIMLVNCQYVPMFDKLHRLLCTQNARVNHYIMVNDDTARTIHAVNTVFSIMFLPGYQGFLLRSKDASGHNGIQTSDFMLANWTNAEGQRCESLVLFDTPNNARAYRSVTPGTLAKLLEIPKETYQPIKRSYMDGNDGNKYVKFCAECAGIERNRRVFAIKPDLCLEHVPVDILLNAAREGALGQTEEFALTEKILFDLSRRRYKSVFESRKAHHTIMKRSAVWKFVRTGRLSDHFWGLRPFTLQERATIIRHLIDQIENNPYFHIYFLKDNQFLRDIEVFCFDGKGLLIVNADTNYDLMQNHSEVILEHPEFQRLYKDFFLKHLIRERVISNGDTLDFLRSLVEYCEDPNSEEYEN